MVNGFPGYCKCIKDLGLMTQVRGPPVWVELGNLVCFDFLKKNCFLL